MSAGYRSPEGVWIGGVSSPSTVINAGYRSLEAFWIGGASSPSTVAVNAGYRSMEAFWLGGASASTQPIPPTPTPIIGGGWSGWTRSQKKYDDDEILFL